MHPIYNFYLLASVLQLPTFLFLGPLSRPTRCILLSAHPEWRVMPNAPSPPHRASYDARDTNNRSSSSSSNRSGGIVAPGQGGVPYATPTVTDGVFLTVYGPQEHSLYADLWCMTASAMLFAVVYMLLTRSTLDDEPAWWPKIDALYDGGDQRAWLQGFRALFWSFVWFQVNYSYML